MTRHQSARSTTGPTQCARLAFFSATFNFKTSSTKNSKYPSIYGRGSMHWSSGVSTRGAVDPPAGSDRTLLVFAAPLPAVSTDTSMIGASTGGAAVPSPGSTRGRIKINNTASACSLSKLEGASLSAAAPGPVPATGHTG
ncbi:unnamed protein product [Prorocentrum cordatum]|uniref:Subtilisin n=1 Tax=Prorocentrum cordatum TaxID=2364126 RepID=A0ABN9ST12_9DINO|nr:unnamed protein product [Polarella glacialis]